MISRLSTFLIYCCTLVPILYRISLFSKLKHPLLCNYPSSSRGVILNPFKSTWFQTLNFVNLIGSLLPFGCYCCLNPCSPCTPMLSLFTFFPWKQNFLHSDSGSILKILIRSTQLYYHKSGFGPSDIFKDKDYNLLSITAAAGTVSRYLFPIYRHCFLSWKRSLQSMGLFPHAALLYQTFAYCRKFSTAASRRSLGHVLVSVWLIILLDQLLIIFNIKSRVSN